MFNNVITIFLLALLSVSVFAEKSPLSFLDTLETLAEFKETDVLEKSVRDYYAKDSDLEQGKYPTLLHDAAILGKLNLLKYLVEHDTHGIEYAYQNGPTPLGYIAGDNQIESAKILLIAGADTNNPGNTDGVFPLSSAVTSGNTKMIELLLSHGALVHIGAYFQSPLGLVLEKNDIEILQLFDRYPFKLDSMDDELRILLVEYLNSDLVEEEILKILIKHGLDIYAQTEEKPSFIKEYGKQIEHSDVKHMLQDLYNTSDTEESTKEEQTPAIVRTDTIMLESNDNIDNENMPVDDNTEKKTKSDDSQTSTDANTETEQTTAVEADTTILKSNDDNDNENIPVDSNTAKKVECDDSQTNTEINTKIESSTTDKIILKSSDDIDNENMPAGSNAEKKSECNYPQTSTEISTKTEQETAVEADTIILKSSDDIDNENMPTNSHFQTTEEKSINNSRPRSKNNTQNIDNNMP